MLRLSPQLRRVCQIQPMAARHAPQLVPAIMSPKVCLTASLVCRSVARAFHGASQLDFVTRVSFQLQKWVAQLLGWWVPPSPAVARYLYRNYCCFLVLQNNWKFNHTYLCDKNISAEFCWLITYQLMKNVTSLCFYNRNRLIFSIYTCILFLCSCANAF